MLLHDKAFTYIINSSAGITGDASSCDIELEPIHFPYEKYQVRCTAFTMNCSSLHADAPQYILLAVSGLSDGPNYCMGLESDTLIIAHLNTHESLSQMTSGEGSVFTVSGMSQKRRIHFELLEPDLINLGGGYLDINGATYWTISLVFSPILDLN